MPDFDLQSAQAFQDRVLARVRETQRMLDADVTAYYRADRVDNEADARENLRGLHNYIKRAYRELGEVLTEIERRL